MVFIKIKIELMIFKYLLILSKFNFFIFLKNYNLLK